VHETRRAVLEAIDEAPVSGPALADRLDVSRAAVWKHVEALRASGFTIESGEDGYALVDVPEYGGDAVAFGLAADFTVEFHERVGSTNERARALAAEGAADVVVLADEQTGGRGRLDRVWASPSGGVWLSILLRPELPPTDVPLLTLAAGVATVRAVEPLGVDARLKWPNDVLVPTSAGSTGERKLAGILTESAGETGRTEWVIVGIGLNANLDAGALPEGATSLRAAVGDVNRRRLVQRLLTSFDALRRAPEEVLPAWREVSSTLGRRVRVETQTETVVGTAVDVEAPGLLIVETEDDTLRVHAGDCEHLRPA